MHGGGYSDLGNFEESQFSYKRTRNVDTMSQCASLFTQACGLLPSFCLLALLAFSSATLPKTAKTRVIFSQKPCKITTDNLASLKKYKFSGQNSFAQFGKVPSETSDTSAQFGKYVFGAKDNVTHKFYKKHLRVYLLA